MYAFDALSFGFKGKWGTRTLIIILLMIIPIVNIFGFLVLAGYSLRTIRASIESDTPPNLDDMGGDFGKGLVLFLCALVFNIPLAILSPLVLPTYTMTTRGQLVMGEINPFFLGVYLIVSILWGLASTAGTVHYAMTDNWRDFFAVPQHLSMIVSRPGATLTYVFNAIVFGIIAMIAVTIGFVLLVIPGLIAIIAVMIGSFYLQAQWGLGIGFGEKFKRKNSDF